jgi:hypothetical protein
VLELLCAGERPDVERPQPTVGDELRDLLLRSLVVAGDQDVELLAVDLAGGERGSEGGVGRRVG